MASLIDKIKEKRIVFTVTTGRSGTQYLAQILSLLRNFTAEHEDVPAFHDHLEHAHSDSDRAQLFWLKEKLPHIASVKTRFYSDTSHVACKGFLEALLGLEIIPDLIILRRDKRDVAKSLWQLGTIPGRTELGIKYLISPQVPETLAVRNWDKLTDYQLCYWYTLEIERRQVLYSAMFGERGARICNVTFDELISGVGLKKMQKELALPGFSLTGYLKYMRNKAVPVNSKRLSKKIVDVIDFDTEESKLLELLGQ